MMAFSDLGFQGVCCAWIDLSYFVPNYNIKLVGDEQFDMEISLVLSEIASSCVASTANLTKFISMLD